MKNKDLEIENEVRKMKRLSFGCLGEGEKPFCRERSGRKGTEIAEISVSQWIERYRELKTCVLFVEELSRICREVSIAKESRWIEVAIEHPKSFSMDRSSYREAIENAIKSSLRVSIDSLVVERY